jgi:hypothetical protein
MKLKHTPGPWNYSGLTFETENGSFSIWKDQGENGSTLICEIDKGIRHEKANANAKLIAAAPELLENLIRCVDRLEENGMGSMSAVRRAKEAIKKATQ